MDDYAPLIERAFGLVASEQSYAIATIDGELPDFIRGAYYINGPARFQRADLNYRHWLDGDGMVCTLRFDDHTVHFANRYVRSDKYVAEEKAGHALFRTFGTAFEADQLKRGIALESPVNVSVYPFGDTLLAFGEQGMPWALDPVTLETRGLHTFSGRINDVSPFSAHPKFDPHSNDMFNFGVAFSATRPQLNVYRFDVHDTLRYRKRHRLAYPCSVHDCSLSPTYLVLYLSPYLLDMSRLMHEGQTLMDALQWHPDRGSQLCLVDRDTGDLVTSLPIGQRYCLHLINSFETEDHLTVDVVEYDQPIYDQYQVIPDLFSGMHQAQPVRFIIDKSTCAIVERRELEAHLAPDFPAIDPRRTAQAYDDFWMLSMGAPAMPGRKFFNQLLHLSWHRTSVDVYQAPVHCYLGGEPIFIGHPHDPTSGVILCQLFDAEHTHSMFAVFDAFQVSRGPVARLHLREAIPPLFHATFKPS